MSFASPAAITRRDRPLCLSCTTDDSQFKGKQYVGAMLLCLKRQDGRGEKQEGRPATS